METAADARRHFDNHAGTLGKDIIERHEELDGLLSISPAQIAPGAWVQEMKAVLLVGGFGTRLRPAVSSLPKVLAPVGNRPFLELLVRQLGAQGISELVMCTGYLAEQLEEVFQDGSGLGGTIEYYILNIKICTSDIQRIYTILSRYHINRIRCVECEK